LSVDLYYRYLSLDKWIVDSTPGLELGDAFDVLLNELLSRLEDNEQIAWHGVYEEGDSWKIALITYTQPLHSEPLAAIEVGDFDTRIVWDSLDDSETMDSEIF
jgi:hypothetical protein